MIERISCEGASWIEMIEWKTIVVLKFCAFLQRNKAMSMTRFQHLKIELQRLGSEIFSEYFAFKPTWFLPTQVYAQGCTENEFLGLREVCGLTQKEE